MENWNTGWDPYESLKASEHNINQLILAVNNGSEIMKDLANKYNHQQEVIQQLMFQNRKLQNQITNQTAELSRIITETQLIKSRLGN